MMVSVQPYLCSPEIHPILAITDVSIIIGEYSGRACHADGTVEMIGCRRRIRLDRKRLEAGEEIYRRYKFYKSVGGGADIAGARANGKMINSS